MKINTGFRWGMLVVLSLVSLLWAGCAAEEKVTPEGTAALEEQTGLISATGEVVPVKWADLSLGVAGRVAEVLVAEGEAVEAGQVLARLEGEAAYQADLEAARFTQLQAQQALDALQEQAAAQTALAQQAVLAARQALIEAERDLVPYTEDKYDTDLDRLRQDVVNARDKVEDAEDDFEPYKDFDPENNTRKTYETRLEVAQHDYEEKQRKQEELELKKSLAEQAVSLAQARLDEALLQAEKTANGPDQDALLEAEARRTNAEAQVTAAQEALGDLELIAPFGGVVTRLFLRVGEWVLPTETVVTLADLATLQIETTDMNEIDAARIAVGDAVIITFDALPDLTTSGKVTRVGLQVAEGSGVNYVVTIALNEPLEALRWGMTAFVDIEP